MHTTTTVETPTNQPSPIPLDKPSGRERQLATLKRYPKGHRPPHLQPGRGGPTIRTLESEVRKVLRSRSYEATRQLAQSIVKRAIKGEPAALAFLGPRLWPILEESQRGAKIVSQGIRLELPGGASVSLLQSSQEGMQTSTSPSLDQDSQTTSDGTPSCALSEVGDSPVSPGDAASGAASGYAIVPSDAG